VISEGALVERLRELGELLVDALEELEAGRNGCAVETLVELGDKLMALQALAWQERRLVGKLTRNLIRLFDLGEERGG
jgi:hypothetical protein